MLFLMLLAPFLSYESIIIIVALLALIRYYIYRKWQFLHKYNIPHDPPSILNLGHLRGGFNEDQFMRSLEQRKKHGLIYGFYVGLTPVIEIQDTDIMRQIYNKEFHNFSDRVKNTVKLLNSSNIEPNVVISKKVLLRSNGKDMNHSLLVASGKKWKRLRSTLSPTFSISKIKQISLVIDDCVEQTMIVLDEAWKEDRPFQVKKLFSNLSLDVIVSSALGTKVNTQTSKGVDTGLTKEVKNLLVSGFAGAVGFLALLFPPVEWLYEKLDISVFPRRSLKYIREFTNAVIEDRLKNKEGHPTDLLQLMLDAEVPEGEITEDSTKGLTRRELIGNAMLMIGAAYDNTSNAMAFLSHNLAFHPDIQAKLQDEIDAAYNTKGCFDYETVKGIKYLDMCLNESMRLYPSLLLNSRVSKTEIVINGLRIPKGIVVQFPMYGMAHDPDYWQDPWEFRPDRMEDMSQIDPMMFQPFGAGPRNCIGMRFAEMEIKMTMCHVLHRYTLKPCDDTPRPPLKLMFKLGMTLKEDFNLKLLKR